MHMMHLHQHSKCLSLIIEDKELATLGMAESHDRLQLTESNGPRVAIKTSSCHWNFPILWGK